MSLGQPYRIANFSLETMPARSIPTREDVLRGKEKIEVFGPAPYASVMLQANAPATS